LIGLNASSILAQDRSPLAKDIAVLVDLSGSIDPENSKAARILLTDLVSANFGETSRRTWEMEASPGLGQSNELRNLAAIVGNERDKQPLWAPQTKMVVSTFGNREHTWQNTQNAPIEALESIDSIHEQLDRIYGLSDFSSKFNHGTTFYELAKGAFALRLQKERPRISGYYLFVISDELDDLTNMPVGTSQGDLDRKNEQWRQGLGGGGYNPAELEAWTYLKEKIEESKLATFNYRPEPTGGRKRVNVVLYTSTIVDNIRQLAFTEPDAGTEKVISEVDSRIAWRLSPATENLTFRLNLIPTGTTGESLVISGIQDQSLELLKPHPHHPELPLRLANGRYELSLVTEEEDPMVTTAGTAIELKRLDPVLSFSPPLLHTTETSPGNRPTIRPFPFASAGEVVFTWEVVSEGSQAPFLLPPDQPYELAIYRVENAPREGNTPIREIREAAIGRHPVTTALIAPGAPATAGLLTDFKLDDLEEVLSGTFLVEITGTWGDRRSKAQAAFSVPLPRLALLNVNRGGGSSENNRRFLKQGKNAVIRFSNTHAGWPRTDYVAQIDGDAYRKLTIKNEQVDLSLLKSGDYTVDIQFRYHPDPGQPERGITAASTTAYVKIGESRWMYYLLGGLAAATLLVFGYHIFTSRT